MNAGATLANGLWLAANARGAATSVRALRDPRAAQDAWLRAQVARHQTSEFGRTHDFAAIRSTADFTRLVPLTDYAGVEKDVARIRRGERDVLSCERVTHLAPTSGSSGACKLIPFTAGLQRGFNAAVAAWMTDLARARPALALGPAYWSISPLTGDSTPYVREDTTASVVPVGFADDAEYLGGASAWLVRQALAVRASVRLVRHTGDFWALTLLALLRQRDLRLISIWHPSFLDLLVGAAEPVWGELLDAVAAGDNPWLSALPPAERAAWTSTPDPRRRDDLRRAGPLDWARWWPSLQVVSCWGEQAARPGWLQLKRLLGQRAPQVLVQPKGLLATEAVVTIPLGSLHPLAVCSHFFEFIDERGEVRLAHQLERGGRYEVVVTNGGGLWRYRLGDMVEHTGRVHATPSLRFLGRRGSVSDLRGEKLHETFVHDVLSALWDEEAPPAFAALRARDDADGAGYELLVSTEPLATISRGLGERLDAALRANPHYDLARRLGQLSAVRIVSVGHDEAQRRLLAHSGRLGNAKPRVLLGAGYGMR